MPIRLTNRFSADRDLGPARIDTNFEDVRRWSGEIDSSFTAVDGQITDINTELSAQFDFANALQSDITAEAVARDAADDVLAAAITDGLAAEAATRAADDTTLANAITGLGIVQNAQCIVSQSSQAVANTTNTNVSMPTEVYDLYGWHSGTSHTVIPTVEGIYTATALVNWSATGSPVTRPIGVVWVNGTDIVGYFDIEQNVGHPRFMVPTVDFYLDGSTDTVSLMVWQNSGASKNVAARLSVRLVNAY